LDKILSVNDDRYIVLGTASVNSGYTPDKLKTMWGLADTVLRNNNTYYVCSKIVDAEFTMVK